MNSYSSALTITWRGWQRQETNEEEEKNNAKLYIWTKAAIEREGLCLNGSYGENGSRKERFR